jgi:hypothetical protein
MVVYRRLLPITIRNPETIESQVAVFVRREDRRIIGNRARATPTYLIIGSKRLPRG